MAKAGIDAAEHFFTHGIGENRQFSPYVDMHHGVDASLSLDRTWKTFRWRGNPIAVRLVSGQGHDVPAADGGRRSFFARFGRAFGRRRLPVIAQVGNPFESVGRSEHIRTIWRALRAASVRATIYDVYGHVPDGSVFAEMGHCRVDWVADGIRIFHLNGAEMQYALPKIEERQPGFLRRGYNVLAPAWELPRFPAEWAKEFNRFHEIWAPTAYVQEACSARSRCQFSAFAMLASRTWRHTWINRTSGFRRTASRFLIFSISVRARQGKILGL